METRWLAWEPWGANVLLQIRSHVPFDCLCQKHQVPQQGTERERERERLEG